MSGLESSVVQPRTQKSHSCTPTKAVFAKKHQADAKYQKEFRQYHSEFAAGYLLSLIDDARDNMQLLYGSADYTRDREFIIRRIKNEGFTFITHTLPILMTGLLNLLEHGTVSFPQLKLQRGTNYPQCFRRMFEIVMNEHNYNASVQATAMDLIYNISTAFKKLRGRPNMDNHQQQYDDFVKVDSDLGKISEEFLTSPEIEPIMSSIATQWGVFASGLSLDDLECVPRPGPGATVGNLPKHARYSPSVLYKSLNDVFPYEDWFYSHPWDVCQESRSFLQLSKAAVSQPHSEYLLVPKTFLKWRGICKEANEVQFLQQALRRQLYARIENHLSKGIPIRNQEVHQELALTASENREKATIDESEASDRIARLLVWHMTQLTPDYRDALMAVSTKYVKPPKWANTTELLETKKFAPMGSAVCFPIMSLVHYFLIKAIILVHCPDRSIKVLTGLCNQVSVYGDDIVLPSSMIDLVYEWLPKFGMKINQTKSFAKSFFRESCGCHAYKGMDITPVYIKYTNFSSTDASDAKTLASLLAAESTLHNRGKTRTAKFLRDHIETKWRNLPYVSNVTPLVGYQRPPFDDCLTDFSMLPVRTTSRKWDRWNQSFKYRLMVWNCDVEQGVIPSENEAYLRYHCLGTREDVKFTWTAKGTSFRLDDWIRRVDDKASRLSIKRVSMPSSALYGHNLQNENSDLFSVQYT
jgi:hypothetical protein